MIKHHIHIRSCSERKAFLGLNEKLPFDKTMNQLPVLIEYKIMVDFDE